MCAAASRSTGYRGSASYMHERTPKLKNFPSRLNPVLFFDLFWKAIRGAETALRAAVALRIIANARFSTTTLRTQGLAWRSKKKIAKKKNFVKDKQVKQFDGKKCFDLDSDHLPQQFFAFSVFLSIKVDEHWVDFLLTHGGSFCVVWAVWVGMERLQMSAFAGRTGNYALEGEVLSTQWKPASVGIDPQIGVKFCNFRTQKAVFLDHFVL